MAALDSLYISNACLLLFILRWSDFMQFKKNDMTVELLTFPFREIIQLAMHIMVPKLFH